MNSSAPWAHSKMPPFSFHAPIKLLSIVFQGRRNYMAVGGFISKEGKTLLHGRKRSFWVTDSHAPLNYSLSGHGPALCPFLRLFTSFSRHLQCIRHVKMCYQSVAHIDGHKCSCCQYGRGWGQLKLVTETKASFDEKELLRYFTLSTLAHSLGTERNHLQAGTSAW